jgi:hypothetical protein
MTTSTHTKRRRRLAWAALPVAAVAVPLLAGLVAMLRFTAMPGTSFQGTAAPLNSTEERYAVDLAKHVRTFAGEIGDRNIARPGTLDRSVAALERELLNMNYDVAKPRFYVGATACENVEVTLPGASKKQEVIVVGAHYDSAEGAAGADDNASGVAATLVLARAFRDKVGPRTLRFVFFANEEPPYFQTDNMGSRVYAREARARGDNIVLMLSLETLGYYRDEPHSQRYPTPVNHFYSDRGNFVGFVGRSSERDLVRDLVARFRSAQSFPSDGAALPEWVEGVGWSDHWAFWQERYPAVMVTDTAPFRNPNYHTAGDTPDTLDYRRLAVVVHGLERVIEQLRQ